MKRRYTWTIFQNIEYSAEQDQVRLYNFFNDLLTHMPEAAKQIKDQDQLSTSSAESLGDDFLDESDDSLDEGIDEPKTYKGPQINLPLEKQDLDLLINLFRKRKYKLHARYVALILREAAKKLRRLDNINKASTEVKGAKTVACRLFSPCQCIKFLFSGNCCWRLAREARRFASNSVQGEWLNRANSQKLTHNIH